MNLYVWSPRTLPACVGLTPEPVLGWRLWRLRDGRLRSWGIDHIWRPGSNRARCLVPQPCSGAPGRGCHCGFWALFSLIRCIDYGRHDWTERAPVLGLVQGWGEVAMHGEEGFRAEYAAPLCLFTDWIWEGPSTHAGGRAAIRWWRSITTLVMTSLDGPVRPGPGRSVAVQTAASTYGLPLVSLQDALGSGLVAELGAGEGMRREVDGWGRQAVHG
ncbi:MAG: hypothetical protein ACREQM_21210 [Candidatus Dormibacteraceae bacterium]